MSDWYQAVVSHAVMTADAAQKLGADIAAWLIAQRIIEDQQCDGCRGKGLCYRPGPDWMHACAPAHGSDQGLRQLQMNGVCIVAGRDAVVNFQGQFDPVACPRCAGQIEVGEFLQAGSDWCEGKTQALHCPHCEHAAELPLWRHPDAGFVMLAFEFSNWPPLSDVFIDALGKRLGHPLSLIESKS